MLVRASAVAFLLGLAACRTVADEPAGTAEPATRSSELGARCAPGGSVDGYDPCGTKQRVSLAITARGARPVAAKLVPCTLATRGDPTVPSPAALATCIAEHTLYVEATCMMCRVPGTGWSASALLEELTASQSIALQGRIGLAAATPLVGEKAWRRALAGDAHASL